MQDHLSKTTPLKIRMHAHPLDFSPFMRSSSKPTLSYNLTFTDANEKLSLVREIHLFDMMQILVPRTTAQISPRPLERKVVECPHGFLIRPLILPDFHRS